MGFLISISHARGQRELFDLVLQADQGGIKVAAYSYHSSDFGHDPGPLAPSSITVLPVWAMSNVVVRWKVYSPVQCKCKRGRQQGRSTVQYSKSRTGALSRADQGQARVGDQAPAAPGLPAGWGGPTRASHFPPTPSHLTVLNCESVLTPAVQPQAGAIKRG
jgi:hypothetical protein